MSLFPFPVDLMPGASDSKRDGAWVGCLESFRCMERLWSHPRQVNVESPPLNGVSLSS